MDVKQSQGGRSVHHPTDEEPFRSQVQRILAVVLVNVVAVARQLVFPMVEAWEPRETLIESEPVSTSPTERTRIRRSMRAVNSCGTDAVVTVEIEMHVEGDLDGETDAVAELRMLRMLIDRGHTERSLPRCVIRVGKMYLDGVPNYSKDSGAFDPDFLCRRVDA